MRKVMLAFVVVLSLCFLPTASADDVAEEVTADAGIVAEPDQPDLVEETTTTTTTTSAPAEPTPPPSTWASLGWQLASYVVPVLGALLVALVGFGIQWIRAKTADLRWQSVLDQLHDAVDTAVAAVQQTTVDALKKAAEDGKLTSAEAQAAFADALARVKTILGTKGLAALQSALKASQETLEAYLRSQIEAAVGAKKVTP